MINLRKYNLRKGGRVKTVQNKMRINNKRKRKNKNKNNKNKNKLKKKNKMKNNSSNMSNYLKKIEIDQKKISYFQMYNKA